MTKLKIIAICVLLVIQSNQLLSVMKLGPKPSSSSANQYIYVYLVNEAQRGYLPHCRMTRTKYVSFLEDINSRVDGEVLQGTDKRETVFSKYGWCGLENHADFGFFPRWCGDLNTFQTVENFGQISRDDPKFPDCLIEAHEQSETDYDPTTFRIFTTANRAYIEIENQKKRDAEALKRKIAQEEAKKEKAIIEKAIKEEQEKAAKRKALAEAKAKADLENAKKNYLIMLEAKVKHLEAKLEETEAKLKEMEDKLNSTDQDKLTLKIMQTAKKDLI